VRGCRTCHVVNVILDNKPEAVGLILVLLNIGGGVRLAHGDRVVDEIVRDEDTAVIMSS